MLEYYISCNLTDMKKDEQLLNLQLLIMLGLKLIQKNSSVVKIQYVLDSDNIFGSIAYASDPLQHDRQTRFKGIFTGLCNFTCSQCFISFYF